MSAAYEETPYSGTMLHLAHVEGKPHRQRNQQVDAEADGSQQWAEQPETLAQALSPGGLDAACGPYGRDQVLQCQEKKGQRNVKPIGKESWRNQSAKTAKRINYHALDHAPSRKRRAGGAPFHRDTSCIPPRQHIYGSQVVQIWICIPSSSTRTMA